MKRILVYISVFFLMTNAALGQERYRVEKANCSFEIPESWELISEEGDLKEGTIIQHFFIDSNIATRATSSYGHEYNIKITNEVSPNRIEKKSEARLISRTTEPKKQELLDKSVEFLLKKWRELPGNWDGAKLVDADCYYDVDKHAYYGTTELHKVDVGTMIEFYTQFLGGSRETSFTILWEGDDPDGFLDYAYSIVDSFSYDEGFGFGEGSDGITLNLETASRSPHFWLLPTIGIILVIFILRKWAAS